MKISSWASISLASNVLFVFVIIWLLRRSPWQQKVTPGLKPYHQLNYQQMLALLEQEADNAAQQKPKHLTVLVGDSLSQFFPPQMLPPQRNWLKQGIAGETTTGLLQRLQMFDRTQPEVIFVMIGTNDLSQEAEDKLILANQQKIMHYLHQAHPDSQIIFQSILPRTDKFNYRIEPLNRQLAAIAEAENVYYLNLYPLFADAQGNIRSELSTDGLHLNSSGYLVWQSALQLYSQLLLKS